MGNEQGTETWNEPGSSDDDFDSASMSSAAASMSLPPEVSEMKEEFHGRVATQAGVLQCPSGRSPSRRVADVLAQRRRRGALSRARCAALSASVALPSRSALVSASPSSVFCGLYNSEGSLFMSAVQEGNVTVYDVEASGGPVLRPRKDIHPRDVGWSVLDVAYAPDNSAVAYSSWSNAVHMVKLDDGREAVHERLEMADEFDRVCFFAVAFSPSGGELVGACSDQCLYLYDLERREVAASIPAHGGDINTVCYADSGPNILLSGSDDSYVKVWDRRLLDNERTDCVGSFSGHRHGVTFVDSRLDGRYLLSNSKDQTIKVWDLRRMGHVHPPPNTHHLMFDYRHGVRRAAVAPLASDASVLTLAGHTVVRTLIRARFSPQATTGQRFIYSGSGDGGLFLYDTVDGSLVGRIGEHRNIVRDVSWHPTDTHICTASWDGTIRAVVPVSDIAGAVVSADDAAV